MRFGLLGPLANNSFGLRVRTGNEFAGPLGMCEVDVVRCYKVIRVSAEVEGVTGANPI